MMKSFIQKYHIFTHMTLLAAILIIGAPVIFGFIISTQSPIEVFSDYSHPRSGWPQEDPSKGSENIAFIHPTLYQERFS